MPVGRSPLRGRALASLANHRSVLVSHQSPAPTASQTIPSVRLPSKRLRASDLARWPPPSVCRESPPPSSRSMPMATTPAHRDNSASDYPTEYSVWSTGGCSANPVLRDAAESCVGLFDRRKASQHHRPRAVSCRHFATRTHSTPGFPPEPCMQMGHQQRATDGTLTLTARSTTQVAHPSSCTPTASTWSVWFEDRNDDRAHSSRRRYADCALDLHQQVALWLRDLLTRCPCRQPVSAMCPERSTEPPAR